MVDPLPVARDADRVRPPPTHSRTGTRPRVIAGIVGFAALSLGACAAASPEADEDAGEGGRAPPAAPTAPGTGYTPPPTTLDAFDPGGGADAGAATPPDAAAPPTGSPGTCTPGLCLTCDAAGRGVIPPDDEGCPPVECGLLDRYAVEVVEGVAVCFKQVHFPTGRRCVAPGQCRSVPDPVSCGDVRPTETVRAGSACEVIEGCVDTTPGTLAPAGEGQPCEESGICRPNGMCDTTVVDQCPGYGGAQICDAGVHVTGERFCDLVSTAANCLATCQMFGSACLAGFFADAAAPCAQGEPAGCLHEAPNLRCRCQTR